jgi:inhibitor of KinA
MHDIKYISLSENALLLSFGDRIDLKLHHNVLQVKQVIENNPFNGFIETVPAYNSLTVYYNPLLVDKTAQNIAASVQSLIQDLIKNRNLSPSNSTHQLIRIPVCYDPSLGIDVEDLSISLGLSVDDIIRIHSSATYTVFMLGFTPGFPYAGIVDEKLLTKRKSSPRLKVEPGSVAIAGNQTAIYPLATPGGWNIIGRTPLKIFDMTQEQPFILATGDQIQFDPISIQEYETLSALIKPDSGFKHSSRL